MINKYLTKIAERKSIEQGNFKLPNRHGQDVIEQRVIHSPQVNAAKEKYYTDRADVELKRGQLDRFENHPVAQKLYDSASTAKGSKVGTILAKADHLQMNRGNRIKSVLKPYQTTAQTSLNNHHAAVKSVEAQRPGIVNTRQKRLNQAKDLLSKKKTGILGKKIGLGMGVAALGIAAYKGLKSND